MDSKFINIKVTKLDGTSAPIDKLLANRQLPDIKGLRPLSSHLTDPMKPINGVNNVDIHRTAERFQVMQPDKIINLLIEEQRQHNNQDLAEEIAKASKKSFRQWLNEDWPKVLVTSITSFVVGAVGALIVTYLATRY